MSDEAVPSTADTPSLPQNGWSRVLAHLDEGVVIVDETGVVREVNRAAAGWLQQSADQLIGQPWIGPLVSGSIELQVADRAAHFEVQLDPIEWNDHPAHLILLRPEAQTKPLTIEAYARVLHAIPDVVLITRLSDGVIMAASDFAQQALGYSREALIGQSTLQIEAWAEPEERAVFIGHLRNKGICQNFATSFRVSGGQILPALLSGRVVELEGQPCILAIVRNISEWR